MAIVHVLHLCASSSLPPLTAPSPFPPMPNWSPAATAAAGVHDLQHLLALHGPTGSSVSVATTRRVRVSMTSPVDGYAYRPSMLNVIQPG